MNNILPTPKWVVLNSLIEPPEWHVFENATEMNHFIKERSLEDWDYTNTYKIFEVEVKNLFKSSVSVSLDIIK
jgi:hypothetical protein